MDERSGKEMGEYNWSKSGHSPRRVVAIFDQVSERFGSGSRPTGPRGSPSNSESLGSRMRRERQRISHPGMRVTSSQNFPNYDLGLLTPPEPRSDDWCDLA